MQLMNFQVYVVIHMAALVKLKNIHVWFIGAQWLYKEGASQIFWSQLTPTTDFQKTIQIAAAWKANARVFPHEFSIPQIPS